MTVFNVIGQEVAVLANEWMRAGSYQFTWDAVGLPSGIYYLRVSAGEFVQTTKMVLMK